MAVAVLWLCACSSDTQKLTQIVVVVDSDLRVPDELDGLQIEVDGVLQMPRLAVSLSAPSSLPRSLGLVHAGGPLGPVRVTVRGQRAGESVVERSAEVSFKNAQTLKLALALSRACAEAGLSCDSGETCVAGACAPRQVDDLPVFDGRLAARAGSGAGAAGSATTGGAGAAGVPAAEGGGGSPAEGGAPAAGSGGTGGDGSTSNQPPACSIETPGDGASFYQGEVVSLSGVCTDPESGPLFLVRWRSNRDGTLGALSRANVNSLSLGDHTISLCASDPVDSSLGGCASEIHLTIKAPPTVSASIGAITQGGTTPGSFDTSTIVVTAQGVGVEPLTYTWTDSLLGELGTGESVSLQAPVPAGKHTLLLRVTDARKLEATDSKTFTVLGSGSALFESYGVVNTVLSNVGGLTALAASGSVLHVGTGLGVVLAVDPASAPGSANPSNEFSGSGSAVRDLFIHASSSMVYVSTSGGLTACSMSGNLFGSSCSSVSGAPLPANDVKATLRVTAASSDSLIIGTSAGMVLTDTSISAPPKQMKPDVLITRSAASATTAWLATSTSGLHSYDLTKALNGSPRSNYASPISSLSALALGSSQVWVGGSSGMARYDIAAGSWSSWNTGTETSGAIGRLVSNDVRALAIARPTIGGTQRDVIWIATGGGLGRYDTSTRSFTTYTTSDGLPSNVVKALLVLTSGEVVVGTDAGLVLYRGT
jgi:hypothetical protein